MPGQDDSYMSKHQTKERQGTDCMQQVVRISWRSEADKDTRRDARQHSDPHVCKDSRRSTFDAEGFFLIAR